MTPRISPLDDSELDPDVAAYWPTIADGLPGNRVPGLFRILAHNPALVKPFHRLASALFLQSGLDPIVRQLVILRTVWLERCDHAWQQHLLVSRDAGVPDDLVEAIGAWGDHEVFTEAQRAALAATDLIVGDPKDRGLTTTITGSLDAPTIVAIEVLAGLYVMICRLLNSSGLAADAPVTWPDGPQR
jgi:4-carboxymuconolactone decarboxylase